MAKEKKPSIYVDRGTIGSSDELDEYGVWVKSEPQELSFDGSETQDSFPEFSNDISSIDDEDFAIPEAAETASNFTDFTDDDFAMPDIELETDGEDDDIFSFDDFADQPGQEDVSEKSDSIDFEPAEADDDGFPVISMDDFIDPAASAGLEDNTPEDDTIEFNIDEEAASHEIDDKIPVEDFIGFSEPESEESSSEDFSLDDISDEEPEAEEISLDDFSDEEPETDEISFDDISDEEPETGEISLDDISDEEPEAGEISLDDFSDEEPEVEEISLESLELKSEPGDELPVSPPIKQTAAIGAASLDLSTQLLQKIAEELSSIRTELSGLKMEFSGLKTAPIPVETEKKAHSEEDEDEKISLTGAELINIMNTADFTEETGTDAIADLSDDMDSDSLNIIDDAVVDLEVETVAEYPSLEEDSDEDSDEGSIEVNFADEEVFDFHDNDSEEFNEIRENGVLPITSAPAPEDSAYLAEDPMAELSDNAGADSFMDDQDESFSVDDLDTQDFSMDLPSDSDAALDMSIDISENKPAETADEPIDLSDAVIDEPDFSMDIQDNPLEEPSLEDISINLDLSELGSEESISEELSSEEMDTVELDDEEFEIPKIDEEETELDENLEFSFAGEDFTEVEETESQGFAELESGGFLTDEEESAVSIEDLDVLDVEDTSGELEELPLDDFSSEEFPAEEFPALEPITEEVIAIDDDILELEADAEEDVLEELIEEDFPVPELPAKESASKPAPPPVMAETGDIPSHLKKEIKAVLSYMDNLLEALPENKIEEFAKSEYYETYKKLFKDLGLV